MSQAIYKQTITFLGEDYPFDNSYGSSASSIIDGQAITDSPDFEIDIPTIDVSRLLFLAIVADADMVLKFNSSSVPAPQLDLKAGKPYVWCAEKGTTGYTTCLLTADVNKVFCTGAAGKKLWILASFAAVA